MKRLFAATSLLALSACQSAPLPLPSTVTQVQRQSVAPATQRQVVRQQSQVFAEPVPVAVFPDRLVFQGTQHRFTPGQVLMGRSQQNQDFLRRVRSSATQGNTTVVQTTNATLFDVFEELDLAGVRAQRAPERIQVRSQRFNLGGVVDIVVDMGLTPDFSDTRIRLKDSRLQVRVAPRLEIDTRVRSEYRFLNIQSEAVPLKPVGQVSFTAARFPVWVGPVPLVFHIKPGASLDWGHSAQGNLGVTTQLQGELKAAIELEAAVGERPTTRSDSNYQLDGTMLPPDLKMTGSARARLSLPQIQVDSEIAGLVGPFVQAGPYVDASYRRSLKGTPGNGTVTSLSEASLGLTIDGGITPTRLFGAELSREVRVRILDRTLKQLYRKETTEPLTAAAAN